MDNWQQELANHAVDAVDHDLVQSVCRELADNLGIPFEGLPRYGIEKVAMYAATVARAQTMGIDPDLLRITSEDFGSVMAGHEGD